MSKTIENKVTTAENIMSTEITTTHCILAIPLTRGDDGKLSLPESPSGKTLQVATTHGNCNTGTKIKGAALFAGANVYVRND